MDTLEQKAINRINEISQAREDFLKEFQAQISLMNTAMIEIAHLVERMDLLPADLQPKQAPVPTPEVSAVASAPVELVALETEELPV
jgi:hypothetical protein